MEKCKHTWKIVTEKTIESAAHRDQEQAFDNYVNFNIETPDADYFKGTYICILKCTFCGKLDKTIERT